MNGKNISKIILGAALLVVVVYAFQNLGTTKDEVELVTPVATSTPTATTDDSPLTLSKLQARPDWNPTMETEWMVRVEDGVTELEDSKLEIQRNDDFLIFTQPIKANYSFVTYNAEYKPEFCEAGVNMSNDTPVTFCPPYKPSQYNEFIVLSSDTGEVLHKYKLKEGYTLLRTAYAPNGLGGGIFLSGGPGQSFSLSVGIYDPANPEEKISITRSIRYYLDLLTGELYFEERESWDKPVKRIPAGI